MIYRNIEDIEYPFLHDAILLVNMYTKGFKSLYISPKGECAITLKGKLKKREIQRVMMDLDIYVTSESSENDYEPVEEKNFMYRDGNTIIATTKGIDYRTI